MPRKPIDYSKTIIYKLVCKDLSVKDLYVGHTTNWIKRKGLHKSCCNNTDSKSYNLKVYTMMRDSGGWDNWDMVEIEKYPCNDEREASARERYWYEELYATMNTHVPNRTDAEWREDNKEYLQEYERNRPNKEERKQKNKEYSQRPEVKERTIKQGYEYRSRPDVKEHRNKKAKEYREKNKQIISQKKKQKITCSCGSIITKDYKARHERSTKHKKYIEAVSVIQRVEEILNQDVNIP
jgi:hypothetical protein